MSMAAPMVLGRGGLLSRASYWLFDNPQDTFAHGTTVFGKMRETIVRKLEAEMVCRDQSMAGQQPGANIGTPGLRPANVDLRRITQAKEELADAFLSSLHRNDRAAMRALVQRFHLTLGEVASLYNKVSEGFKSGLSTSNDEGKRKLGAHLKYMMDFVKEVVRQMSVGDQPLCTDPEYRAFCAGCHEVGPRGLDDPAPFCITYVPPQAVPAQPGPLPLPIAEQPVAGGPQPQPEAGDRQAPPAPRPPTPLAVGAPPAVVAPPVAGLAQAMQVVGARGAADLATFQNQVGARLGAMAGAVQPADGWASVVNSLKDAVVADSNAVKLTGGQKFAYGFLKVLLSPFALVARIFGGHLFDRFEKWKARKAIDLNFVAGAVDGHLAAARANAQRIPAGVTMRNDLLNLLAYVPAGQVRLLLKTAILGAIPEGTDVFKDQLADRIVDQVSEKLYATGAAPTPWAKIQTALAGVADAIVREQRQSLVAAVGGLEADQTLAANIQATTRAALEAHQATLAARLAEIGQLPDDPAPAPVPEGGVAPAVAQDSKAELQLRVQRLTSRIEGELARRGQVVTDVGTDLAPLEADPALGANIQNTAQAGLTRHQAALAALQGRIEALPEDSRGDVPGRLAAVTGRITTELARRETEKAAISGELQRQYENEPLLGEEHIGVISQNLLGRKQAGLTALQARIDALPADVRGDVPTRLQAVVGRITTEQTRRQELLDSLDQRLRALGQFLAVEGNLQAMTDRDLSTQEDGLIHMRQKIEQLPEDLRANPTQRLDELAARIAADLPRRVAAEVGRVEAAIQQLEPSRVSGGDLQRYGEALNVLRVRIDKLPPESRPGLIARLTPLIDTVVRIQNSLIAGRPR